MYLQAAPLEPMSWVRRGGGALWVGPRAEKAQCRLQLCKRRYQPGTCPPPYNHPSLPPAPPQKDLKLKQVSTRKQQGRGALLSPQHITCLLGLCSLWSEDPKKQGRNFLSLQQVSTRSGHTVGTHDVPVTYS